MFARGVRQVLVVGSLAEARREAAKRRGWLLCGEKRSLPPRGFHHGNSPVEFSGLDLKGTSVVFVTTNGTRAFLRTAGCRPIFAGAVVNASAVAKAAYEAAARLQKDVMIQCAGDLGGRAFDLEDAFCAGAIVDAISKEGAFELNDEAEAARRIYGAFGGSAEAAFRVARHGEGLRRVGLGADVAFCAQRDLYDVVPVASMTRAGLFIRAGA
jgi:2-phosphosulfolactate phosphatase